MTGDRIELRGLRLTGRVGVLPIEVEQDQPLELDLDAVCDAVERTVGAGHVALLERLAALVADAVFAVDARIDAVDIAVRKLRPPVPQQLATSGVRIRRVRDRP